MDLSSVAPNPTPPHLANSQLVSLPPVETLNLLCLICITLVCYVHLIIFTWNFCNINVIHYYFQNTIILCEKRPDASHSFKVHDFPVTRLELSYDKVLLPLLPLLRELNWLPVREQLRYRDIVLAYKCQNGLAPQYLMDKFSKRSCIHNRDTRARDSLQIPLFRTKTGQRSFVFRGTNIWNNLDDDLKQRTSLTSFKRALRDSLLRQTFPKP